MTVEVQPYFAEGERYPALIGVRAEGDEYETAYVSKSELVHALAENAKLRELSSIMLKCIMANKRRALICWECPAHREFDELRSFCCIKHDAAELGIEVD